MNVTDEIHDALSKVVFRLPLKARRELKPELDLLCQAFGVTNRFLADGRELRWAKEEGAKGLRLYELTCQETGRQAYLTLAEAAKILGLAEGSLRVMVSHRRDLRRELHLRRESFQLYIRKISSEYHDKLPTELNDFGHYLLELRTNPRASF